MTDKAINIRCYRRVPGDLGIPDEQAALEPYSEALQTAIVRLRAMFETAKSLGDAPLWADLLDAKGVPIEKITITPDGPRRLIPLKRRD